jgi:Leucine-rich repeat (LRR) protein
LRAGLGLYLRKCHTLLLSDNKLKSLPNDLSKAANLRILSLASNRFSSIPIQLAMIRNLERVDLEDNLLNAREKTIASKQDSLFEYLKSVPSIGCFGNLAQDRRTANITVRVNAKEVRKK